MPVYVDPPLQWPRTKAWPYGWVSHMYADTEAELHAAAAQVGLKRAWCSDVTQPDSRLLHYDLTPSRRKVAVRLGAVEVDHEHKRSYYRRKGNEVRATEEGDQADHPPPA